MKPIVAILTLMPAIALAQERPAVVPSRDVDVTYRAGDVDQRMRWLASAHRLRIDPPGAGVFMVVDYTAHTMAMVRPADHKAVQLPSPVNLPGGGDAGVSYVRGGSATVAGLPCTDWNTRDNGGGDTTVCFTADGVMLRARRGDRIMVEATRVTYAAQDPAEFVVPSGFQVITPPTPPADPIAKGSPPRP